MICHFYIKEKETQKQKQYYGKTDYAYINLFSDSRDWIVKGTPGHGIRPSPVPCLNCFEINEKFYRALKELSKKKNEKFELGVIFNKRMLKNYFGSNAVIDVELRTRWGPQPLPPLRQCHYFDYPERRKGVLDPFNYCDVVRVEIPMPKRFKIPMAAIPYQAIMGMLVKRGNSGVIRDLLESKRSCVDIFPLL